MNEKHKLIILNNIFQYLNSINSQAKELFKQRKYGSLIANYIPIFLFLAVIIQKIFFLFTYSLQYADGDQTVVWMMAHYYSEGKYLGLFFWGQKYNFCLDAMYAVPLIWFGIKAYTAVPIATFLIHSISFILIIADCFRNNKPLASILICLVFLLAPINLQYLFSTGITLGISTVIIVYFIIRNQKVYIQVIGVFLIAFISLGIQNTLPLAAFIIGLIFFRASLINQLSIFLATLLGIICYYIYFIQYNIPIIHNVENQFSINFLLENIYQLHLLFFGLGPVIYIAGVFYLLLTVFFTLYFALKKQFNLSICLLFFHFFIFLILCSDRAMNGDIGAFFSRSRYVISVVPVVFFCFSFISKKRAHYTVFISLATIGFGCAMYIGNNLYFDMHSHFMRNKHFKNFPISEIKEKINEAKKIIIKTNPQWIVSNDDLSLMYALQCETDIPTIYTNFERRTLQYKKFYYSQCTNVLWLNKSVQLPWNNVTNYTFTAYSSHIIKAYQVKGAGLNNGNFLQESGWLWWQKLGK